MKKIILILMLLSCFININGYCIEDKVVAVVNNEVITKTEVESYKNLLMLQMGEDSWKRFGLNDDKILESLIENKLLVQEAKDRNVIVKDREVESRLEGIKKGFGSDQNFSQFLISQGLSVYDFKERITEQLYTEKIISGYVRNRIFVSPKEVTDYYQANKDRFFAPESIIVDSIFVLDEYSVKEVHKKLNKGEDFSKLQNEYSKRTNLGLVKRGQLKPDVENIAFNLKIGEFSKPVEMAEGFYIFLIKDKIPPKQKELMEVQSYVSDLVYEMKFNMKLKEWLEELKEKAYISKK